MTSKTLPELLTNSAYKHPSRIAIVFGQKKINYKTLEDDTNRIAAGLARLGIKRNDPVALFMDNCPEFIISYYAILKAGAILVPINYMFKTEEAKFILQDSQAVCIITSRPYLEMAEELRLRVDSLKFIVCTAKCQEDVIDFHKLRSQPHQTLPTVNLEPLDVAAIMYTSGTTGHPKGAMLTHHNLVSNAIDCSRALKTNYKDTYICILPLFHSFAATVCMNLPIFLGSKIVVMKTLKPFKRVIRAILKNRVNIFVGIPSVFSVLKNIRLPKILHSPLIKFFNPVRICVSGAAALPVDTLKGFEKKFRIPLIEGYGLTEASPVVTLNPIEGIRKPGSIGLALSENIQLKIVDSESKPLQYGRIGELLVKGPNVMVGYLNQPEANLQTIRDNWLYTGDMAKMDHQGYVYIAGRKKEMINVRGLNVYPREIEEVLYQNPKIKECAIIGIADEHKGEVPKGFVVLKETEEATQRDLLDYLRQHLAPFKIPKFIEFRLSLPKNATGKILKRLLQNEENAKRNTK